MMKIAYPVLVPDDIAATPDSPSPSKATGNAERTIAFGEADRML